MIDYNLIGHILNLEHYLDEQTTVIELLSEQNLKIAQALERCQLQVNLLEDEVPRLRYQTSPYTYNTYLRKSGD